MKTTEEHFALFRKHCQEFIEQFGMKQYEVNYTHKPDSQARSTCFADPESGIAVINFAATWGDLDLPDEEGIRRSAFHEVQELVLWELRGALRAFYSDEVVDKKIHFVIRTLENAFFK